MLTLKKFQNLISNYWGCMASMWNNFLFENDISKQCMVLFLWFNTKLPLRSQIRYTVGNFNCIIKLFRNGHLSLTIGYHDKTTQETICMCVCVLQIIKGLFYHSQFSSLSYNGNIIKRGNKQRDLRKNWPLQLCQYWNSFIWTNNKYYT